MQLIDTHVHVNFDRFQGDLEEVSHRWREKGVSKLVHSCVHPDEFETIKKLSLQFPELYCAVGLHPLDTQRWEGEKTAQKILHFAQSFSKVVAIGEMGLDFYKDDNSSVQEEVCWRQLEIAHQLDKPVIIHCRDAAKAMVKLLQDFFKSKGKVNGVMHCWTGNPEETQWFLELGMYVSFSGVVTFKNAHSVHESAKIVPSERLLIETDCPFLAPAPYRGKRNEPAYVLHVAEKLAELRKEALEAIASTTTANAHKLFKL
ncbi:TatD family hydrolase [Cyanobacterium stanieri LEGE 03274]|uniref:D-aminoacyl-tRNA deacylase n=1 Tax=Cyanobacterium stanieri LEGE 03274 TaxID=1828756 RepID=A0ABR9V577_9CHRO|nr:TatD family hydrolase [Cyanobacterium stanieri]MBE9223045.1 TatD family hydrolase [Cyanobacterium stanieri LEGE 03274]